MHKPADFGKLLGTGDIQCQLCPLYCTIPPGGAGVCRFRANIDSQLVLTNYAEVTEAIVEPIEKKPLLHYYPTKKVLSVGTNGCNMGCTFCQNWEISQDTYPTRDLSIESLVKLADQDDIIGVCYTYNEPLVWYEYVRDSAKKLKEAGLKIILNTNGLINEEPLRKLLPLIDAVNLDIKGFSEEFHTTVCKSPLHPVLDTARILLSEGKHLEISHLVIQGVNDDECMDLGRWVLSELGPVIPLHINAYYPRYLMTEKATTQDKVLEVCESFRKMGHMYVYPGNTLTKANTICHYCSEVLVERSIKGRNLLRTKDGNCPACGTYNHIILDKS